VHEDRRGAGLDDEGETADAQGVVRLAGRQHPRPQPGVGVEGGGSRRRPVAFDHAHRDLLRRASPEGDSERHGEQHRKDEDPEHGLGLAHELAQLHEGQLDHGAAAHPAALSHAGGGR
jgi:hypothetical protein